VAASKTYVTCLVALAAVVIAWAGPRQGHLVRALGDLPGALRRNLEAAAGWVHGSGVVDAFVGSERAIVTSRGYDLATALEIAIKLQETAGIFADGMSTADLEHGPVALAGPDVPVLAIRPGGEMGRRVDGALERVRATGARPWIVGGQEAPASATASADGHRLQLPVDLPAVLAPAAFILPGQLLAEAVARGRGRDPDLPTGLTKVTLTH
jgi:glucosamine--fructose-6-phosphate aminotransferase (isomerizing)